MVKLLKCFLAVVCLATLTSAQSQRLWLLTEPNSIVEYDPSTFAAKQSVTVPSEVLKAARILQINRKGQMLFAPNSDALQATTQLMVKRSLSRWLGDQIDVRQCTVTPGPGGDYSQILVQIAYLLIETQSLQQAKIVVT